MTITFVSVAIFVISLVGGLWLANRNAAQQQRQTKILLFALYFWILAFVQLIITAILYALMHR